MPMLALSLFVALLVTPVQEIRLKPADVAELDLGRLKGSLVRQLAWSPDGREFYLQTYDPDRQAQPKEIFHYVIPASGGAARQVPAAPDWAVEYWSWKSTQASPGDPTFKIELETDKRISAATALPMGGDLARGGVDTGSTGASMEAMLDAARQSQNAVVYRMRLLGQVVGEWINHPIVPGLTFGWGPAGTGLVAYAEPASGKLVIMDKAGTRQKFDDTKSVVLPGWSPDGSRLVYLENRNRNRYTLVVATVAR